MISESTPVAIGFVITVVSLLIGGLVRIDRRFSSLESQVKEALRGRMTRQEHRIWALEFRVRNPTLKFPDDTVEPDNEQIF